MPRDPDTSLSLEQWADRGNQLSSLDGYRTLLALSDEERTSHVHAVHDIAVFAALRVREALDADLASIDGKAAHNHVAHATKASRTMTRLDAKAMSVLSSVTDQLKYFMADDTEDDLAIVGDLYERITDEIDPRLRTEQPHLLRDIVEAAVLSHEAVGKLQIPGLRKREVFDAAAMQRYTDVEVRQFATTVKEDELWRERPYVDSHTANVQQRQ